MISAVSSEHPEDPLHRGSGPGEKRQVPGGVNQRQVRPVRRHQDRHSAVPEQGHPRDRAPEVERGVRGEWENIRTLGRSSLCVGSHASGAFATGSHDREFPADGRRMLNDPGYYHEDAFSLDLKEYQHRINTPVNFQVLILNFNHLLSFFF